MPNLAISIHLPKYGICPEMHTIANISNIADRLQISQNYSNERLRTPIAEIADIAELFK